MTNENLLEDEVALAREDPEQYLDYLKGFESAAALPSNHDLSRTFYGWRSIAARAVVRNKQSMLASNSDAGGVSWHLQSGYRQFKIAGRHRGMRFDRRGRWWVCYFLP